jgi:hypothetical protein
MFYIVSKKNRRVSIIVLFFLVAASCKKFVSITPPSVNVNAESVFTTDVTAIAALTGQITNISRGTPGPNFAQGNQAISLIAGLSADEFSLYGGANVDLTGIYKNDLKVGVNNGLVGGLWNTIYNHIYNSNAAIEGLNGSTVLTSSVKKQLLGEAKFLRAFLYFYLVNLYGDAPLVLTADYSATVRLSRAPKDSVYRQIVRDLTEAENLLSPTYLNANLQDYAGTSERVRPTKWAAAALLARVYLYTGDWVNAETQASLVINNSLFSLLALNNVFLKNSREAIWQLQPINPGRNTEDARTYIVPSSGFNTTSPVRLSNFLLNSFEAGDQRKVIDNWIKTVTISGTTYYYPYKYKAGNNSLITTATGTANMSEYLMVLRLGEQYLIRAEARAKQNKLANAIADLDNIRNRAGLPLIATTNPSISQAALLDNIFHERQIELFSEWGNRWFDLKRSSSLDAVMTIATPAKANGAAWQSYQQLYPLPLYDLQTGINLKQNTGY